MSNSLPERFERLVIQCRATLDSPNGNPLRIDQILSSFRQLVPLAEEMVEHTHVRETFLAHVLRHLKNIFASSSTGTNGQRSWIRDIPQSLKTALITAHSFFHRHR